MSPFPRLFGREIALIQPTRKYANSAPELSL
jgi:hypothetical protein